MSMQNTGAFTARFIPPLQHECTPQFEMLQPVAQEVKRKEACLIAQ